MATQHSAPGSIDVLIDESVYDKPTMILAGAVVFENDLQGTDERIQSLYFELSGSFYLDDEKSFEAFRANGFHAADDMMEISNQFVRLLSQLYGAKVFIEFSTHMLRPDLSVTEILALLEVRLSEMILRKYSHYQTVRFTFEQNSSLDKYFKPIVRNAVSRSGYRGNAEVEIGAKMSPHALAIVDYALVSYARPHRPGAPDHHRRNWKAVRPLVSSVRCLDKGSVELRRGLVGE